MAVTNTNSLDGPAYTTGGKFTHAHLVLLTDYTAAGTTQPAVGDLVEISTAANWRVKRAADNRTNRIGKIRKIDEPPASTDLGLVTVEWLDGHRCVELDCDDATTITLGNSLIKDGDTAVANNVDGGAATGPIVCVSKSAAAGAIKAYGIVFGS